MAVNPRTLGLNCDRESVWIRLARGAAEPLEGLKGSLGEGIPSTAPPSVKSIPRKIIPDHVLESCVIGKVHGQRLGCFFQ